MELSDLKNQEQCILSTEVFFLAMVERQFNIKVKVIGSDHALELGGVQFLLNYLHLMA